MSKYKDALEDMVWQFAYRVVKNGKPCLAHGGLSALEHAFSVLGWGNPYPVDEEMECDIEGCHNWRSPQTHWDGIYVLICSEHYHDCHTGKPLPKLKQKALDRESKRDPITHILQ